jgi:hypothetical protein
MCRTSPPSFWAAVLPSWLPCAVQFSCVPRLTTGYGAVSTNCVGSARNWTARRCGRVFTVGGLGEKRWRQPLINLYPSSRFKLWGRLVIPVVSLCTWQHDFCSVEVSSVLSCCVGCSPATASPVCCLWHAPKSCWWCNVPFNRCTPYHRNRVFF